MTNEEIDVDPESTWCPWCRSVRRWKGRHADAKHPEKWAAFKEQYKRTSGPTRWEKK